MPRWARNAIFLLITVILIGNIYSVSFAAQSDSLPRVGLSKFDRLRSLNGKLNGQNAIEIVGYYADDWPGDQRSLTSVWNYGTKMTAIAPFAYTVDNKGSLNGSISKDTINAANTYGLQVLALIHNYNGTAFDKKLISTILNNATTRKNLVNNIADLVQTKRLAGVNIDFENISPTDRSKYTTFLSELKTALVKQGGLLTVSVPAKQGDEPDNVWSGGFDYQKIGQIVDRVMIMTYDEHWFGGSPGPVASLPWVQKVVKYTVSQIPADKVLLGLGIYGYDWTSSGKTARSLPMTDALNVAAQYGANIIWDNQSSVPYFNYWPGSQKHVVWFESPQSAALKVNLVKQYNLKGIAIWRLGFDNKSFWTQITQALQK